MDDRQARIADGGPEMPGKTRIDLKGQQGGVRRQQIEQSACHYSRARAQFDHGARILERQGPEHGSREIARTGGDGSDRAEVRQRLRDECRRIHFPISTITPAYLTIVPRKTICRKDFPGWGGSSAIRKGPIASKYPAEPEARLNRLASSRRSALIFLLQLANPGVEN